MHTTPSASIAAADAIQSSCSRSSSFALPQPQHQGHDRGDQGGGDEHPADREERQGDGPVAEVLAHDDLAGADRQRPERCAG